MAIAGAGIISAIGNNIRECLSALESGQAGMDDIAWLDTIHRRKIPIAEVKASNEQAGRNGRSFEDWRPAGGRPDRSAGRHCSVLIAAREALDNAGDPRTAPAGARASFPPIPSAVWTGPKPSFPAGVRGQLREIVQHECGYSTEWVADRLGIRHYQTTISTACSSSANAIGFGAKLIRHGLLDVVVAGGTDALTKFTLNGFNALMILDPRLVQTF